MEYMESRMQDQIEGSQCENDELRTRIDRLEKALMSVRKAAGSCKHFTNRLQFIYERAGVALADEEWDEEWKATHGYAMRTNILSENERLKAELDASLKTIQELQSAISQSRAQALEEAAERCRDIYSWPGAYTAGLLCERTTKACEAAIHALAQKEE